MNKCINFSAVPETAKTTATIRDIQHFSIGDGEGIRTTVFFKGCNLYCPWCHNPETWSAVPQLLYYAQRCTRCGRCAAVCPCSAHRITAEGNHVLLRERCRQCGACAAACNAAALELCGRTMTVGQVMEDLLEDRDFYAASGGGVTLSGGEALLQADFCAELAKQCSEQGVSVTLDTAACVPYTAFSKVIPYVQEVLFDLKAATQEQMQQTGGSLPLVLANLERLVQEDVRVRVRIPVIPAFNDTLQDARLLGVAIRRIGQLPVELLPYHTLGVGKYAALGKAYSLPEVNAPEKTALEPFRQALEQCGLLVTIGG